MKNLFLLCMSLLFYAYGEPVYVFLLLLCSWINHEIAQKFASCREEHKKPLLITALILNLGLLCVFKYTGMLVDTLNTVTGLSIPVPRIRLPIGISFFTFKALSYMIDVYRGRIAAQKSFEILMLYISFFPQMTAGPINRYCDMEEQFSKREVTVSGAAEGLRRFAVGLSKKVLISNTMGAVTDYVYGLSVGELGMLTAWVGAVGYMFQIYFDFSGYSDMAIGLGKMFGFTLKENFRYPYIAGSIQDFWKRWHISLTDWFREYLYIPLGGNRKGKTRTWINRLIVFFCTGLWHGASWTFVVWGMFHGLFQMLETIFPNMTTKMKAFRHVYVLLVVCVGFVFFRANSMAQAFMMLGVMFTQFEWTTAMAAASATIFTGLFWAALVAAVIGSFPVTEWIRKQKAEKPEGVWNKPALRVGSYAVTVVLLIVCMMSLAGGTYQPFIYFQF